MQVLIAEDNETFRRLLVDTLTTWEYDVVEAKDGTEAWRIITGHNGPRLALIDWRMPGMEGIEICQRVRSEFPDPYLYIIMVTSQSSNADVVAGLEAGADDYIKKPVNIEELKARLRTGRRISDLLEKERALSNELQRALSETKTLKGLIPICAGCKKIRNDQGYWQQVEEYIASHSEARFTHGFCQECARNFLLKQEIEIPE